MVVHGVTSHTRFCGLAFGLEYARRVSTRHEVKPVIGSISADANLGISCPFGKTAHLVPYGQDIYITAQVDCFRGVIVFIEGDDTVGDFTSCGKHE